MEDSEADEESDEEEVKKKKEGTTTVNLEELDNFGDNEEENNFSD